MEAGGSSDTVETLFSNAAPLPSSSTSSSLKLRCSSQVNILSSRCLQHPSDQDKTRPATLYLPTPQALPIPTPELQQSTELNCQDLWHIRQVEQQFSTMQHKKSDTPFLTLASSFNTQSGLSHHILLWAQICQRKKLLPFEFLTPTFFFIIQSDSPVAELCPEARHWWCPQESAQSPLYTDLSAPKCLAWQNIYEAFPPVKGVSVSWSRIQHGSKNQNKT